MAGLPAGEGRRPTGPRSPREGRARRQPRRGAPGRSARSVGALRQRQGVRSAEHVEECGILPHVVGERCPGQLSRRDARTNPCSSAASAMTRFLCHNESASEATEPASHGCGQPPTATSPLLKRASSYDDALVVEARSDVVGSLLRPLRLLEARERFAGGGLSTAELKVVEDDAVDDALRLQEEAGVEVVTDGEMRRLSFQSRLRRPWTASRLGSRCLPVGRLARRRGGRRSAGRAPRTWR